MFALHSTLKHWLRSAGKWKNLRRTFELKRWNSFLLFIHRGLFQVSMTKGILRIFKKFNLRSHFCHELSDEFITLKKKVYFLFRTFCGSFSHFFLLHSYQSYVIFFWALAFTHSFFKVFFGDYLRNKEDLILKKNNSILKRKNLFCVL